MLALLRVFRDSSGDVRESSVHAIGRFGTKANTAIPSLIEISRNDADEYVREEAISAVAKADGDGSWQFLLAFGLCMTSPLVFAARPAQRLGSYGARAKSCVACLTEALTGEESYFVTLAPDVGGTRAVRYDAAEALGRFGPAAASALPELRTMLKTEKDGMIPPSRLCPAPD